jgi:hypothetical protein
MRFLPAFRGLVGPYLNTVKCTSLLDQISPLTHVDYVVLSRKSIASQNSSQSIPIHSNPHGIGITEQCLSWKWSHSSLLHLTQISFLSCDNQCYPDICVPFFAEPENLSVSKWCTPPPPNFFLSNWTPAPVPDTNTRTSMCPM